MRLRHPLTGLLASQAKMKVARIVVMDHRLEHTTRELALAAKVSQPQAKEALAVLEAYGVVGSRVAGKAILWKLNRENEMYKRLLLPLFKAEEGVWKGIKEEIARSLCPVSKEVVLFGSIARGEGGISSDLDVCVVTKNKRLAKKALAELQLAIARKYNIVVSPLIYSETEYKRSKVTEGGEEICGRER